MAMATCPIRVSVTAGRWGIAFGLRDGAQINPLNPASYTAIDSLTFLFEGGVSLQNMNISGSGVKLNAKTPVLTIWLCNFVCIRG